MKYQIVKNERIPYENIYNIMITLILAFAIVWVIYVSVPYSRYNLYLIESKIKNN